MSKKNTSSTRCQKSGIGRLRNLNKTKASSSVAISSETVELFGMNAPSWCTPEVYQQLIQEWEMWKSRFENPDNFRKEISEYLKVPESEITLVKNSIRGTWLRFHISPEILKQKFTDGLLFSTPDSGQDPKYPTPKNIKIASKHAARQWGKVRYLADWIDGLSINVIKYPSGKIALQIVDGEHRLWGIIGFQMGLVSLDHPDGCEIYFYSEKICGNKMVVNGMNLTEIIINANKMLKDGENKVIEDDVLNQFNANKIQVTILPMYDRSEASTYFKEKNSNSNDKGIPQMLHAYFDEVNVKIRYFSSIKDSLFVGNPDAKLHPFFEECFPDDEKYNLVTFMYAHMITQFIITGEFVESRDSDIMEYYQKSRAYQNKYTEIIEEEIQDTLDFLYDIFVNIKGGYKHMKANVKPSKQYVQQILMIRNYLMKNGGEIYNPKEFIESFDEFVHENYTDPKTDARLPFGLNMASSTKNAYEKAWNHIRSNFLEPVISSNRKSDEKLKKEIAEKLIEIGIHMSGEELPRKFSNKTIKKSCRNNNWLDIDGISLTEKGAVPIGGHIISDWELKQLSDYERNLAAIREGCFTNNIFSVHENCRAMSKYHNDRMGVLPLSLYLSIINESDEVVRKREKEFKEQILNRHKNYRRAA